MAAGILAAPLLFAALAAAPAGDPDPDTDGDGLSDFEEVHKYFTDPAKRDTDGDGRPDGDWDERREFTYTITAVMRVLSPEGDRKWVPPSDDHQDVRVLRRTKDWLEFEVVVYPLATAHTAIEGDPAWRESAKAQARYLRPGPTNDFDDEMRDALLAELREQGVDLEALDDAEAARRVSSWLMQRAKGEDSFTTFAVDFERGKPKVDPAQRGKVDEALAKVGRTLEEQWRHELFGKGMFETRTHGTCTSTAIYLAAGLRAAGIPTRSVLCIPLVDASDPDEVAMAEQELHHHRVRANVLAAARQFGTSWASHTFNEVWVGGRWRWLNYTRLGQPVLDPGGFGVFVHVFTFDDHAAAGLVTWGRRTVRDQSRDAFGHSNPYSCERLSDEFGEHADVANPAPAPLGEYEVLTISRLYWFDDPRKPAIVDMRLDDSRDAGHLVARVEETRFGEGSSQYASYYEKVGKDFVLRADGHPDVRAVACRGWWVDESVDVRDFYLRISAEEWRNVAKSVPYTLVPVDGGAECKWRVREGVTITR